MDRQRDEALTVLGIPADSDRETVTSAYRRLARATHPDVSPDPDAAQRFATVAAAYRLVSVAPAPGTGLHPEAEPRTRDSLRVWPAPPPNFFEPEDIADDWATRASDPDPASLLLGVSPPGTARSWRRPSIVAGPVMVRRVQPDAGSGGRDG
jgi:hypothetical protein